ncbi:BspA family leucine-rich repeat surface protein [Segatella copri]|uniref:BspA family leucine-rich repeat surface protein n=1 Tax=Segatella copri TaxID=165179 RepID=UPI002FF2D3FD
MKRFTNQSNGSQAGRMYNGGAIIRRFALFPLMLLMLLLLPTRMVAQTDYDESVTLKELAGNPEGNTNETYANLFDGKKEDGNFSKWCCEFSGSAYVILEASKAGIPVGYIITTGNDNANPKCGGRNPLSWKLYGNNEGKEGAWTLIDKIENDKVLQDKNYASYNFDCKCSTSYQYFKWEISAIHSGSLLQVGEFELKLKTCTHLKADGSSALGATIKTVEPTCTEHGYTTKECSLCHLIVKEYLNLLKPHTLTHHALKAATCTETGLKEYWQCNVCNKLFSNEAATTEITDAANLVIPANGHTLDSEGNCTVCGANRYALFNNLDGITDVTITDNGGYPWQILDSNAEGMQDLGFTIPNGSNVLMSSNYHLDRSSSETVIRFNVSKPILLTSQVLVSSRENRAQFYIYVDNIEDLCISGKKQTEYKVLLSAGEHSLRLSYEKGWRSNANADRAFLYNLKTSFTIDDYVADYESSNNTLTFKKITSNNIESLDLNHAVIVNKPTVGKMSYLLGINSLDIKSVVFDKSFKTYAPTSLNSFFGGLSNLKTIKDLKYLNTEQVTDMSYMFFDCALTSLDLSNFNTAKVRDMSHMFYRCSALTSLDLSNFNTAIVTNMSNMFYGCSVLSSLDLSNFNTAKVEDMQSMFDGCQNLSSLDLSNFNTAIVSNMRDMFFDCSALSSLDLSNFYTKKVENMGGMFAGCSALTTIYASDKFVTSKVQSGEGMFAICKNLKGTILEYNNSKTDHTYANYGKNGYFTPVFEYAEFNEGTGTLTFRRGLSKPERAYALNLEASEPGWWSTHRYEIKKVVFDASFANARPTSCYKWFHHCTNLATIEGIENLNTENVTNMHGMFFYCQNLSSLDLTNFNTGNVTNMFGMFSNCQNLSSLDLTSFNTANVTFMNYMFDGCSTLTTIYASEKFVTDQVNGGDMFNECRSLKDYSFSKRDSKYANYKTGYFSKLVGKNGDDKIGAAGETLATDNLVLDDGKDFVAYEPFAAKAASYNRTMNAGTAWGTLCLPFAIAQSQETGCKFYSLTGIDNDNDCITLESYEEGAKIPAGTPVLFKINEGVPELEISAQNADLVIKPVAGTNKEVNLVGSFTKIGGKDNQGLTDTDYIIGKDKFWLVSELKKDGNSKGVGIKPMRAYIHPTTASQARAAMLSIGKGDGTTAIDNLNAISNDANAEYYDANGRRTNGLQKGLNIVKRGSKTYKIMVK